MRCALLAGRMRTELPATDATDTNEGHPSAPKRRCGNLSKMLAWRPPRELVERIEEWRARDSAAGNKHGYTMSQALEHLVENGLEAKEPSDRLSRVDVFGINAKLDILEAQLDEIADGI